MVRFQPRDDVIFQFLLGLDSERGSHASPVQAPLSVVQSRCVCPQALVCSLLWGPSREQKERKILCLEQGEPMRLKVIGHVRVTGLFQLPSGWRAQCWMKDSDARNSLRLSFFLICCDLTPCLKLWCGIDFSLDLPPPLLIPFILICLFLFFPKALITFEGLCSLPVTFIIVLYVSVRM